MSEADAREAIELEEPAPCLERSLDEMVDRSVHHDNVR